jgi:hypothetical protein
MYNLLMGLTKPSILILHTGLKDGSLSPPWQILDLPTHATLFYPHQPTHCHDIHNTSNWNSHTIQLLCTNQPHFVAYPCQNLHTLYHQCSLYEHSNSSILLLICGTEKISNTLKVFSLLLTSIKHPHKSGQFQVLLHNDVPSTPVPVLMPHSCFFMFSVLWGWGTLLLL